MAVFNILSDLDWNSYDDIAGGHSILRTETVFKYIAAGGFVVTVKGTGFAYDALGIPTGGMISEIQISHDGVHYAAYTGLDTALTKFNELVLGTTSGSETVLDPQMEAAYAELRHGDDLLRTSELGKDISGYAGNDTIYGYGGDDWIDGGAGQDRYFGGTGVDGIYFLEGGLVTGVSVDMRKATGNILNDGFGNVETATGIEKYQGSRFGDLLIGAAKDDAFWGIKGNDTLTGNAGHDYLYGGDGLDRLTGGTGDDVIEGDNGKDVFFGGLGFDILVFWDVVAPGHGVRVDLRLTAGQVTDDGYGFTETATGFEGVGGSDFNDTLFGNGLGNELGGNAGNDRLYGLTGNDTLYGGDGGDHIYGGDGNDQIEGDRGRDDFDGGTGIDRIGFWDVSTPGHGVVVNLGLATQQILDDGYGNVENAIGIEALSGSDFGDNFTGNTLANDLWGNDGNDTLMGAGGNDTLHGGDGQDSLGGGDGNDVIWMLGPDTVSGGAGADVFYFDDNYGGSAGDTIMDMTHGVDKIGLGTWWTTGLTGQTLLRSDQFIAGAGMQEATTFNQHVIYDSESGLLFFDVDGIGTNYSAELIAILPSHPVLTYQDFVLID